MNKIDHVLSIMKSKYGWMESTYVNTRNRLKRVIALGVDLCGDEELIIEAVENIEGLTFNIFHSLLNTTYQFRKEVNLIKGEKLINEKILAINSNHKYFYELQKKLGLKDKKVDYPSIDKIMKFTDRCFIEKRYVDFLINYLLINSCCRNLDLDCVIGYKYENDDNYLIIEDDKVKFIRNRYKTANVYGEKIMVIDDPRVVKSLRILINRGMKYLLIYNGERIKKEDLSRHIRGKTYNKVGQRIYMHASMMDIGAEFMSKCKSRGTDPITMCKYYLRNSRIDNDFGVI